MNPGLPDSQLKPNVFSFRGRALFLPSSSVSARSGLTPASLLKQKDGETSGRAASEVQQGRKVNQFWKGGGATLRIPVAVGAGWRGQARRRSRSRQPTGRCQRGGARPPPLPVRGRPGGRARRGATSLEGGRSGARPTSAASASSSFLVLAERGGGGGGSAASEQQPGASHSLLGLPRGGA